MFGSLWTNPLRNQPEISHAVRRTNLTQWPNPSAPSLIGKGRVKRSRGKMKKTRSHKTGRCDKRSSKKDYKTIISKFVSNSSPRSEKFSNAWNFVHYWGGHLRNSHRVLGVGIASNKYLARHRVGDIVALTMPLSRIKVYRSSSYRIIRQLSE